MSWKRRGRNVAHGCLLLLAVCYSLLPIYFMFIQSLKTAEEDVVGHPLIVTRPTLENYRHLFEPDPESEFLVRPPVAFPVWVQNTVVVFGASLALTLALSLLAAYGLGRLRPPGWRWSRRLLFATYVVPHTLLFVPLYELAVRFGLDNSQLALVIVYPMLSMPFCVWILSAFFQTLPREIEESAYIEGASRVAAFLHIVLPMSRPVLVAAGLFTLGTISSDIVFASILLHSSEIQTVVAGLGAMDVSLEELTVLAGINLAGIPLILLSALFARGYVRGLTAAMVEGA
ncbi:MAG: carbohydrate ABC transporter permease [Candidatus Rokubacteria bacterium]|nr:carbohydrate ABC transporter permease [Candidatus Rokubacteria bacterium]